MSQLLALKGRDISNESGHHENLKKEADQGSWSNGSDQNSSDVNLDSSRTPVLNTTTTSSASSQLHGKNLFPSNLRPSTITQLLQAGSSRSDFQCLKVDPHHQMVQSEESFCHVFVNGGAGASGVEDQQPSFWPWPAEQHNYFH